MPRRHGGTLDRYSGMDEEMEPDFDLVDCDNHYYETDDCFTRHIEEKFRERTVWVDRESRDDGFGTMMLGQDRLNFFSVGVGDYVGPPGIMKSFFKGETEEGGAVNANPIRGIETPEYIHKAPRLALMDEQGVEASIMIPTLGASSNSPVTPSATPIPVSSWVAVAPSGSISTSPSRL